MQHFLATMILMIGLDLHADETRCLTDKERSESAFYPWLQQQAYAALDRRMAAFEQLKTAEDVARWNQNRRQFFLKQIGGLPEKSPLNARTVKTIQTPRYTIECVIFDSVPGHRITANLYLPKTSLPVPGIVVSSGHSRTAKTADYNQRFGIMMAENGMAALCYDPIGQGERSQILTADGQPAFSGTTTEHFLIGVGSILVGRNTARFRIHDGVRAVDYLCSRPEIDSSKIGFTGCSGGGTLTSYVMALDDRVACAAPACYLTTFRQLISTIGPQDSEQNIFGQIAFGMDHPDYVLMRAPRPVIISSTTDDFFSIAGAWDTFRQAKRAYARLGFPERVDLVEAEGKHGVRPQNLASIAQWMKRWLQNEDVHVPAREIPVRDAAELLCTQSGQVAELPGERSVIDLNFEYAAELQKTRKQRGAVDDDSLRHRICELLQLSPDDAAYSTTFEDRGRVARDDYHIDRFVLKSADRRLLPGLTFHPPSPDDAAWLYLRDDGKEGDHERDRDILKIVAGGNAVVAVDLSGQGETQTHKRDPLLGQWKTYYLSYLLGRPLLSFRVEDTLKAARFTAHYQKDDGQTRDVHLVGEGQAGIVALHAAALQPQLFASVTLRNVPRDWTSVVRQHVPAGQLDSAVHGALAVYDLPDLVRLAGKNKVQYVDETGENQP